MRLETGYPKLIRIRDARGGVTDYFHTEEFAAVHAEPELMPAGALQLLEDNTIGVFNADALSGLSGQLDVGPVYSLAEQKATIFAVPTGRVLIRFHPSDKATDHSSEIEQAGYRIEEALTYAPEAAWVSAAAGGIASALRQLHQLESIATIQHVEPQLIRPTARRE